MNGSSDEGTDRWRDKLSDDEVERGEQAMTDEGEVMPQGGEETDGEMKELKEQK